MAAASASPSSIAAISASSDGHVARVAATSSSSSNSAFFPARAMLGGRLLSSSPTGSSAKFGSVLSVSTKRNPHQSTQIRALDPDFYKIPYVEGVPVGKRLKLWNIPPNCDHGELHEWLNSIPDVNAESLEFTDDPELNAQGVGGFVEFGTKQEACMAIVRLDGRKFKGRCIRMDFVEKRPHEREIGGRRNRPSRNYPRDRSYSGSSYSGSSYSGSGSGMASNFEPRGTTYAGGVSSTATVPPSGNTFDASANPMPGSASPNWSAPPPPPPRAYGPTAHRIFVGNLSWNMDDNGLLALFRNHGNVLEARVMRDRETGSSRGFGFVAMSTADEMNAAIAALDGTLADGRALKVSVASR
eukprot:c2822_g1_i1 orf=112-1182(+)